MALPVQRSLQHLRDEVRARAGFGSQVGAASHQGLFADFVREAEQDAYYEFDFRNLKTTWTITTVADQVLYTWPDGVDLSRTISLQVNYGEAWIPVKPKGIEWQHDTFADQHSFPLRYDDGPQLEVWPTPDDAYEMRLEGYVRRPRPLHDPAAQQAGTAYAIGDVVVPRTGVITWPAQLPYTAHRSHFVYECTKAGTSNSSTEPSWPTGDGETVSDGTVTWTARLNTVVVPDTLVARLARYKAKLHYRHPDAEEAMGAFQSLLANLKKGQHTDRRYVRPTGAGARRARYANEAPWIPPRRV